LIAGRSSDSVASLRVSEMRHSESEVIILWVRWYLRYALRNRLCRAVNATCPACIAESRDPRIYRLIGLQMYGSYDTAHAEEWAYFRMNDGAMAAELPEARFETDRDVQQVAVANRMFDLAGVA
jgi:hypothetical protein